jgi:hypothetical protein
LLALSAFPSLVLVFAVKLWVPESARFNVAVGKNDIALETLERIARTNNKPMLLGCLIVDDDLQYFTPGDNVCSLDGSLDQVILIL